MKQQGQTKRVIVTGCLAQRYSHELAGKINFCTKAHHANNVHQIMQNTVVDSPFCRTSMKRGCLAEDIPETDLVMGFQNYAQMPESVGGLLGVELPTDPFAPLDNQRVQVIVGLILLALFTR